MMAPLSSLLVIWMVLLGFVSAGASEVDKPATPTRLKAAGEPRALSSASQPKAKAPTTGCTLHLTIEGGIGPAQLLYLEQGLQAATAKQCRSVLLTVNTPGGALSTTRIMVEKILAAEIPVLCLAGPAGGHAASAGALLMLACHVNGAVYGTNIGAATPVLGAGQELAKDMRSKMVEDTSSWAKSLAKLRGRSVDAAEKIVTDAKSFDAEEAARLGFIDTAVADQRGFLDFADGRKVAMPGDTTTNVEVGSVIEFPADLRVQFLKTFTDPQFAYLLFMLSLALLYFEITHPGTVVPGVIGGIGLLISMIAFHALDVYWGGAAMIALGIGFLIAEAFLPAFGILGIGGIVALVVGSILLYEPGQISLSIVLAAPIGLGLSTLALAIFAYRTRRLKKGDLTHALLGQHGEVVSLEPSSHRQGQIAVQGEFWRFVCDHDLSLGAKVKVIAQDGLVLKVKQDHKDKH